jgi:hypothetical protein
MPKVSPIQNEFVSGEIAPWFIGRSDSDRYKAGLKTCIGYVPTLEGPLDRRPGTVYVYEVKSSAVETHLLPFEFNKTQAYVIEAGDLYFRFYRDYAIIESGGSPVEVVTPYLEADLPLLRFTQSADVLYLFHPDYAPRKLTRTSHTVWTLSTLTLLDGPYLDVNTTSTTLTASAVSGVGITITASSATGINGGSGFQTTDVGRLIRMFVAGSWGYVQITAWTSNVLVTASVISTLGGTTATANWRLGVFSGTTGYPGCGTFYDGRLAMAGATNYPQRVDLSVSNDFENFAPSNTAGTVAASNAISATLNSSTVNAIYWLAGDEKGLLIGTAGGPWVLRPATSADALSATNVNARQLTGYGCANVHVARSGKSLVYAQAGQRKVRELAYHYQVDGFMSQNLTVLSGHITESGVEQMVIQQEPKGVIWSRRADGVLLSLTFERDTESVVAGWARQPIAGYSNAGHTADAIVESLAVIPSPDGTRDDVWMIVKRYINGGTQRYVEYMKAFPDDETAQEDMYFVDSGVTYDGAATDTITGLSHLEGEEVTVLGDGMVFPNATVSGGQITLSQDVSVAHVGLGYNSDGETLPFDAGAADGTAQGKTQRIHRVGFRLHRSLGLSVGQDFDDLDDWIFRTAGDNLGEATALFTGVKSDVIQNDYSNENGSTICFRQSQPLPSMILAILPQLHTQDR